MIYPRLIMVVWALLGQALATLIVVSIVYLVQRMLEWTRGTCVVCRCYICPHCKDNRCTAVNLVVNQDGMCLTSYPDRLEKQHGREER